MLADRGYKPELREMGAVAGTLTAVTLIFLCDLKALAEMCSGQVGQTLRQIALRPGSEKYRRFQSAADRIPEDFVSLRRAAGFVETATSKYPYPKFAVRLLAGIGDAAEKF